jgi:phosphoglycerol transferase MdoB-like AlkP superfamily enzyme
MQDAPASANTSRRDMGSLGYIDLCRAQAKPLSILAACCMLVAASYSESTLTFLNQFASIYSFSFLVMLFALVLPGRLFLLSIPLAVGALDALSRVNQLKISALSLPITFVDVRTFIADPAVLVNAVGIRDEVDRIVSLAYGVLAFVLLACAFYKLRGYSFLNHLKLSRAPGEARTRSSSIVLNVVAFVAVLIAAQTCLVRYGRFVHAHLTAKATNLGLELWQPSSQVILSRELGVLEYMAFSFAANDAGDIPLEHGLGPTVKELRLAAAGFVNSSVHHPKALLPNIVFFHAESTFDPAVAFRLSARVELPLWSKQGETRALSPLRVNTIGGGSWVTEFEVVTGVDSRIFGYQGFYTHFDIAPKVKNSFAKYLLRKGYKTAAFYPVEGSFYNAEKAFRSYGFREFIDGPALRLPADWGSLIDRDIIKAVIEHGAFKRSGPFFYFVGTSQNHGPHHCRSFESERQFVTTFAAKVSFEKNCELNEYLKRAASTSDAFELVLNQLRQIESLTGRPFVLLVYGDHQPWSFTKGIYSVAGGTAAEQGFNDFSGVRTSADAYQTFFHLLASDRTVVRSRFKKPPPASLLPTLASAFVATSYDDLYLPVNFLAFASCGSDIRAAACERYAEFARAAKEALLKAPSSQVLALGARPSRGPRPVAQPGTVLPH